MSQPTNERARFLVCEDGSEYLERFERFLGGRYDFIQSRSASELVTKLAHGVPVTAVLLDLDFRRTELALLVDSEGLSLIHANSEERKRLIANQGIAILASVRRSQSQVPALLFADITPAQQAFLEQKYAPLTIVPSHMGLRELQRKLDVLASRPTQVP